MGVVIASNHDIFVSYSHDDNDILGGYVTDFRNELAKRLGSAVRRHVRKDPGGDPDVFIDAWGMPANGDVSDTLREHVGKSELLFIFVGNSYLKSEYCAKELDWFRDRFNGIAKSAIDRTFIIVMEQDAFEPARNKFSSSDATAIVLPFYCRNSKLPIGLKYADVEKSFETKFGKLVDTAGQRIAGLYSKARISDLPSPGGKIMLGIVPKRLSDQRAELGKLLSDGGFGVHLVDRDDLIEEPEKVEGLARDASMFIQPFDFGPVEEVRGDPPGGHLGRQAAIFNAAGIELRWWLVPEAEASRKGNVSREGDAAHLEFLQSISDSAKRLPVEELAEQLLEELRPKTRACRVLIEYTQADSESRTLVEDFQVWLKMRWGSKYATCPLVVIRANWKNIREDRDWHYEYHGFIVIDRSKTFSALSNQLNNVTNLMLGSPRPLICGVFTLPPKRNATLEPDGSYWTALILFREDSGGGLMIDSDGGVQLDRFFEGMYAAALRNEVGPEQVH